MLSMIFKSIKLKCPTLYLSFCFYILIPVSGREALHNQLSKVIDRTRESSTFHLLFTASMHHVFGMGHKQGGHLAASEGET